MLFWTVFIATEPALAAPPNPVTLTPKEIATREQQLEADLRSLVMAELGYCAAFDAFVAAGPSPRAVTALSPAAVPFVSEGGWEGVGYRIDHPVSGTLQVEVAADGKSFTAHAWQDLDGDGVPAHWIAGAFGLVVTADGGKITSEYFEDIDGDGVLAPLPKLPEKIARRVTAAGVH